MDNINNKLIKLQKVIADSDEAIRNFQGKIECMEDYFEEDEMPNTYSLDVANWDKEIGKIVLSLEILKNINERKTNLIKL